MVLVYGVRVFKRNLKVFRKIYSTNLVINFVEPLIYLFAFGVGLGGYVQNMDGLPYINYLAPGMVALSGLFAVTFECLYGTYTRMVYQKSFDAILATPINITGLVLGELFYGAFKATLFSAIVMVVVYAVGLIPSWYMPLSLVFVCMGAMALGGLSISVTAIVKGIESFNYYFTLVITPLMMLSGIYFPVKGALQYIMYISPFYHVVKVCQLLSVGRVGDIWLHGVALFVMMVLCCALGITMMKRKLSR